MSSKESQNACGLILAGGKGTRSENPLTPKILQRISENETLLEIHLSNLCKHLESRLTFLLGYKHELVIEKIESVKTLFNCEINWEVDEKGETPVTAVYKAMKNELNKEEIFVVILGDILVNVDFTKHISNLENSNSLGSVLVHPNLHPQDSDVFEYGAGDLPLRLRLKGEKLSERNPARAIAGVYFFKKSSISYFNLSESDIAKGVLAPLFDAGKLDVVNSFEYFQDTGTKSRLQKSKQDYSSGAFEMRGKPLKKCIFIDRDGTIIPDSGAGRKEIQKTDLSILTIKAIAAANESGIPVILVTNQPGIAKGFITNEDFLTTQFQLESVLNQESALLDDFIFCPHHPERGFAGEVPELKISCECRKPRIGMIDSIAERHEIDIQGSVFIGNTNVDFETAQNSGMEFLSVESSHPEAPDISAQIYKAISRIKQ
jgi:mannose-1-phosphate guanylyltransferase / phosphomannomutase